MQQTVRRVLVAFIFVLGTVVMWAQPKFNSPFSRFGLGDQVNPNLPSLNGMGDIGAAYQDAFNLNMVNPAALASLEAAAFEIGFDTRLSGWSNDALKENIWSGNLSHLAIAFPLKNSFTEVLEGKKAKARSGMSLALTPQTQVGYNIKAQEIIQGTDEPVDFTYEGFGGTYALNVGYGLKYDQLSVGAGVGFLFGHIENNSSGSPIIQTSFDYQSNNDYSIKGFLGNLGAQYNFILPDKEAEKNEKPSEKMITVGAHVGFNSKTTTTQDLLIMRERTAAGFVIRDTFDFADGVETKGTYPGTIGFGAHYVHKNKLRLGMNFSNTAWSKFENSAVGNQTFVDASTFSVGGSYIPNFKNYKTYLERVEYRAGFVYRKDYREILNSSLTNYAVTIGFGLPVILPRQQASFVNVSFELGKMGSDNTSIQETYAQLSLGFTLNDNSWFFKRKFN